MKSFRIREKADSVSAFGSMLLFLIFAVCTMMMIVTAAGTYSRISEDFDGIFGGSAALRYVSNKIRAADSTQPLDGGKGLAVRSGGVMSVIYFEDGELYERTSAADAVPETSGGEPLFALDGMNISLDGGLYRITVSLNGEEYSVLVREG
ncbi:MAG: DUF4860 domain-containing protein [Oscillospiraceae bacterium]